MNIIRNFSLKHYKALKIFKGNNLQKTYCYDKLQHDYLNASTTTIDSNLRYTITVLNFVSIQTGKIYMDKFRF